VGLLSRRKAMSEPKINKKKGRIKDRNEKVPGTRARQQKQTQFFGGEKFHPGLTKNTPPKPPPTPPPPNPQEKKKNPKTKTQKKKKKHTTKKQKNPQKGRKKWRIRAGRESLSISENRRNWEKGGEMRGRPRCLEEGKKKMSKAYVLGT